MKNAFNQEIQIKKDEQIKDLQQQFNLAQSEANDLDQLLHVKHKKCTEEILKIMRVLGGKG